MSGPRPEVSEANRRRWAARAAEKLATPRPVVVDGSLIAAAKAERGTGKPLAVESLEEKLERAIPGAITRWSYLRPGHEGWQVRLEERVLGTGATEREAIDRAIFLFGGR